MGLLDKLWDDTLAGPQPDSGLSKLRKHFTFSFRSNKVDVEDDVTLPPPKVTRSIMIKRPAGWPAHLNATPPDSPAGSTPPVSPFAAGGGGRRKQWNRFRRRSTSDACYERPAGMVGLGPGGPSPPHEV